MQVQIDVLAVFFAVLQIFCVERNRWLFARHVVVGPLSRGQLEERASKEFFVVDVGDSKLAKAQGGRAVCRNSRTFDSTKGFPGEDVAT